MSGAPSWISDTVGNFGHQLGLHQFALNENGAAAVRFENGTRLSFEYGKDMLAVSVRIQMPERSEAVSQLLAQAHYARGTVAVRACYLKHTGEGSLTVAVPKGQVTVNAIGAVFQNLWTTAEYLRRKFEWQ